MSPLLMGFDVRSMNPWTMEILRNVEVIAVNKGESYFGTHVTTISYIVTMYILRSRCSPNSLRLVIFISLSLHPFMLSLVLENPLGMQRKKFYTNDNIEVYMEYEGWLLTVYFLSYPYHMFI